MSDTAASEAVRACIVNLSKQIGHERASALMLLCTVMQNVTRMELLADSDYEAEAANFAQAIRDAVTLAVMALEIDVVHINACVSTLSTHCSTLHHSSAAHFRGTSG